jgi:hypothetical protein
MLSMMEQVSERESRMENNSSDFDLCTLPWYEAVTHAPSYASAAMTQVRVQDGIPLEKARREPLGAYPVGAGYVMKSSLKLRHTLANKSPQNDVLKNPLLINAAARVSVLTTRHETERSIT